jgi:putative transposase
MSNYLRDKTPGGMYFFTLVTYNRQPIFLIERNIRLFKKSLSEVKMTKSFKIVALVILPDHIHMILALPENDYDYSKRISLIKKSFGKDYGKYSPKSIALPKSAIKRNERGIWQRRFWEHKIRDDRDYLAHINYIHLNPVKHGLVDDIANWKWSTYFTFLKSGFYEKNWGKEVSQLILGAEWD